MHKATFSKSLAHHIVENHFKDYEVRTFNFIRGRKLKPNEESSSGLYGIIGTRKDIVLRVQLDPETAKLITEDESRHLEEIYFEEIRTG